MDVIDGTKISVIQTVFRRYEYIFLMVIVYADFMEPMLTLKLACDQMAWEITTFWTAWNKAEDEAKASREENKNAAFEASKKASAFKGQKKKLHEEVQALKDQLGEKDQ